MRVQGADLTKQVHILYTAVDDFVKTVTAEIADSRQLSDDSVESVDVPQRSDHSARADSGCENSTPASENETCAPVNGTDAEEASAIDTVELAQPTNFGPAVDSSDTKTADTDDCHKTGHRPAGYSHVTKTNARTSVVKTPSASAKHTPSRQTKRSHGDRNRRSREQSRHVDTRRNHDSYADRLICKVARMTRVDVAELWSARSHDEHSRHRRHHDDCKCVTNSSPVTTSSGYESDVDCIREEEIDKLLHGDCSTTDRLERSAGKPTGDCREPFILRPDDKYDADYAMDARTLPVTTRRRDVADCHRNVQDMTSPRGYHDHTRKLSRVARSMEQIIRDLQAPQGNTKCNAKPAPAAPGDITSLPVNGNSCGVGEQALAAMEEESVDVMRSSGDVSDCETSDMLSNVALRVPVIHDDEGKSAFRPYRPCSNTSASTAGSNAGNELPSYGHQNEDGPLGMVNVHCTPDAIHTSPMASVPVVYSPSTLLTHRSASPDSGRGSWSNYGTSPDYADRTRQTSWRAMHRLSEVDAFVENEPIYETIDDGAMLPRDRMTEYASPPPLPQRPVRCSRRLSERGGKYATVGECASSGWGHTPPQLPPREYQRGGAHFPRDTDTCVVSTTACRNTRDSRLTRRTSRKATAAMSSDGVTMLRQQPEVPHLEDIVKSSDIVDLSGAHVYTVADVLESIHGYVGHLSSGDAPPDKPADECATMRPCPKLPDDSVGRDADYHLLTKAAKSPTTTDTRSSSLYNARPPTAGCSLSTEQRRLEDDSADWCRPRGCESRDLEMRTASDDNLRRHSSDLVWSSNRTLQGTYC